MKKRRLHDLVPPWANGREQRRNLILFTLLAALLTALTFWCRLDYSISNITDYRTGHYLEGHSMPTFLHLLSAECGITLTAPVFLPFTALAVGALLLAAWNYAGFRKSLYLMKRLPDRWELLRRCFALPLATLLAVLVLVPLLTWLFSLLYMTCSPPGSIPADNMTVFWTELRRMFYPLLYTPHYG